MNLDIKLIQKVTPLIIHLFKYKQQQLLHELTNIL